MTDTVVIQLPVPPSANRIWRIAGTRLTKSGKRAPNVIKSPAYRAWQDEAGWILRSQRPGHISGAYDLTITLPKVRIDPDNAVKGASDILVKHNVIDDDKLARRITIERDDAAEAMVVTVRSAA
ncbi:RusA family crossover junction endodeoxyribonuclease [Chelatococcus sp. YT9]|uniref:RusA family crossover junction endodeoxyribonuclease n=1 Tax=Chelatococcus sp. YT9 TaxID=2835635 RepID=UPI001BCAB5E3|nr:RusA family crossover junction endodeoxyribonuclease [Chelatococcus sp. YT9]MBS7698590.1 RusA family crossover junction endodeoxyribonuclease [Chelatococcus sp. YT9]